MTENKDYVKRLTDGFALMHASDDTLGVQHQTFSGDKLNPTDDATDNYLSPLLDAEVHGIIRETEELRHLGKLKPFTEGEPIGAYPGKAKTRKVTNAENTKYLNRRKEIEREEMLERRARNIATMKSIKETL